MNLSAGFNFQGKSLEIFEMAAFAKGEKALGAASGGAGAGDEARTRDVLLGKEVLYH